MAFGNVQIILMVKNHLVQMENPSPLKPITLYKGQSVYSLTIKTHLPADIRTVYFEDPVDAVMAMFHPGLQDWLARNKKPRQSINQSWANTADYEIFINQLEVSEEFEVNVRSEIDDLQYVINKTIDQADLQNAIVTECQRQGVLAFIVRVPIIMYLRTLSTTEKYSYPENLWDFKHELTGIIICDTKLLALKDSFRMKQETLLTDLRQSITSWSRPDANSRRFFIFNYPFVHDKFMKYSIRKDDIKDFFEKVGEESRDQPSLPVDEEKEIPSGEDPFARLPADIIRYMALRMTVGEIDTACKVSRDFERRICDPELSKMFWRQKLTLDYPDKVRDKPSRLSWRKYYARLAPLDKDLIIVYYRSRKVMSWHRKDYPYLRVIKLIVAGEIVRGKALTDTNGAGRIIIRIPPISENPDLYAGDRLRLGELTMHVIEGHPESASIRISDRLDSIQDNSMLPLGNFLHGKRVRLVPSDYFKELLIDNMDVLRRLVRQFGDNIASDILVDDKPFRLITINI